MDDEDDPFGFTGDDLFSWQPAKKEVQAPTAADTQPLPPPPAVLSLPICSDCTLQVANDPDEVDGTERYGKGDVDDTGKVCWSSAIALCRE